tara:strand:+ start:81 stop:497 length:417 start_codon:yes stop_codon:yes gene_type:complete
LAEKDYTFNQQLILEAVKSTYGIPSVMAATLVFSGAFVGMRLWDWITGLSLPEITIDIPTQSDITTALDDADVGITTSEKTKFLSDANACLSAHPVKIKVFGQTIKDPLRSTKILGCMIQKGWGTDIVAEWIRNVAKV